MNAADGRTPRPSSGRPLNVVWLYCDELRADAIGAYATGGFRPHTPTIDDIASHGLIFHECYTNSPVCVPSRTATLTGQPPEQTGVYHNEATAAGFPLPSDIHTFPEVFAELGYSTANFGKEHIPAALSPWQLNNPEGSSMGDPFSGQNPSECGLVTTPARGGIIAGATPAGAAYTPEAVAANTATWIATAQEPFLVRASFLQPHTPVIVPHEQSGQHPLSDFDPHAQRHPDLSRFETAFAALSGGTDLSAHEFQLAQASYHDLVSWVDTQISTIIGSLRDREVLERTIIVLTSDHGAYLGENGAFGKHTFARHSHRVPLLICAPGLAPGSTTELAESVDLPRTLFGLCDIDPPDSFHGRDLLNDPAPEHIYSVIGFGARWSKAFPNLQLGTYSEESGWPRRACIRTGRYRLDANVRLDGRAPLTATEEDVFFVDRSSDPDEVHNRAADAEYKEIVKDLRRKLFDHMATARNHDDAQLQRLMQTGSLP
jgi:arylsulfatase A-like enzyme